MTTEHGDDERKNLEKALRQSRRSLPVKIGFALLSVALLWALHAFAGLPGWAAYALGFVAVYAVVGDAINIPYVKRRLRRLDERGVRIAGADEPVIREAPLRARGAPVTPEELAGLRRIQSRRNLAGITLAVTLPSLYLAYLLPDAAAFSFAHWRSSLSVQRS